MDIKRHTIFGPVWREGFEQGRQQGLAEARTEGVRNLALRLLAHRFGKTSPTSTKRVRAINFA